MFSPNTISCSHKIYFLPRPLVWVWWGSRVWSPGICPRFPVGMLLAVTFSWAARWELFFLFLWGGDGAWDADSVLRRATVHREKHGPKPQTAEPPLLMRSRGSKEKTTGGSAPPITTPGATPRAYSRQWFSIFCAEDSTWCLVSLHPKSPCWNDNGDGRQARFWQGAGAPSQLAGVVFPSSARTLPI